MAEATKSKTRKRHSSVTSTVNTIEWMVTALILALTFRAFIIEAYKIPTGSMAPTLRGDHFQVACSKCGIEYDHGFPQKPPRPANLYHVNSNPHCPSCGFHSVRPILPKSSGDRILVYKCGYHFTDPKRWDVFVFKNPTDPRINYIKRVIGRPGEKLEIIDGDIFINDEIARKPEKVQNELWMEIYNNDFQPVSKDGNFNSHRWKQPFVNTADSSWDLTEHNNKTFALRSDTERIHTINYDTKIGNDFKTTYAYNGDFLNRVMPVCSDLKIEYNATIDSPNAKFGAVLSKYGRVYTAIVDANGKLSITRKHYDKTQELSSMEIEAIPTGKSVKFSFAIVDQMAMLNFGAYELNFDLGKKRGDIGKKIAKILPEAKIFGAGELSLNHVSIWRDIHYISQVNRGNGTETVRAGEGNPFTLGEDEFFACGDNSPGSLDSRLWTYSGIGNNATSYPLGVVPRDYLVGKAFYVYWPSGYKLSLNPKFAKSLLKLSLVPNISKMRLIYGGK